MAQVIVKFVGAPDPLVQRRAKSEGRTVAPGTSRKFVLKGYLVTITGGRDITTAIALELGLRCVALWGVGMIYEQSNSAQEQWRLPLSLRLSAGGSRFPESEYRPDNLEYTGLPKWSGRFNQSLYRSKAFSRVLNATSNSADMDGAGASFYAPAAKIEVGRGVTHLWVGATSVVSASGQNVLGIGPWLARYRTLGASLQVTHWDGKGSWGLRLQDDWISDQVGQPLLFTGAAWRTALDNQLWNAAWLNLRATATPRLVPDANEGGVGATSSPHRVSRESHFAYRQNCLPGISVTSEACLIGAPVARLDDSLFELHGSWSPSGSPQSGYVSSRSLVMSALFEVGAALMPAAFRPELLLMKFDSSPVTLPEQQEWWRATVESSPDVRYVKRAVSSRDGTYLIIPEPGQSPVPSPDAEPQVDAPAIQWVGAWRVTMADLPLWFQPGTVDDRSSMFRSAIGSWAGASADAFIPLFDSGHPLPHAFGAVYSTTINGEVEFAFAVKALDSASVPTVPRRRSTDDQPSAPSQALLAVAKTGIVFVRASLTDPSTFSVDSAFHDVIGPDDCGQFSDGMDSGVAYLPQVRFACILNGKRAYAVRVVRYERNQYLAAKLTHIGVNVPMPYTADYMGRVNNSVGGPVFYTDREFGPYPDRSKYEELWFVIDGVRHVVDTRALGGNIEPITEGKYGNGVLDVFQWIGSAVNCHRRQMLGMFSLADESNFELLDFYADEYVPAGLEMNTFAQVSETDVMFALSQRQVIGGSTRRYHAVICRFSSVTGEAHVVTVVPHLPNSPMVGQFLALTCYQYEITDADGRVTQEPCLMLRRGRGDEIGEVLTSLDGGATWELLYDAKSTHRVNAAGGEYSRNGTPSLGLHVLGPVGDNTADPRFILRRPPAGEGA